MRRRGRLRDELADEDANFESAKLKTAAGKKKSNKEETRRRHRYSDSDADEEEEEEQGEVLPRWKVVAVFAAIGICFAVLFPNLFGPLLSGIFGRREGSVAEPSAGPVHHPFMDRGAGARAPRPPGPSPGPRGMPRMPQAEAQPSAGGGGKGGMFGWMLPIYTVGVMAFLVYTLFKMNTRKKKKRRHRYDEMDYSGVSESDDDEARGGLGRRRLRAIQSRLRETEDAMSKILVQLEDIAGAANAGVSTEELQERFSAEAIQDAERNLHELQRLTKIRKRQQRKLGGYDEEEDDLSDGDILATAEELVAAHQDRPAESQNDKMVGPDAAEEEDYPEGAEPQDAEYDEEEEEEAGTSAGSRVAPYTVESLPLTEVDDPRLSPRRDPNATDAFFAPNADGEEEEADELIENAIGVEAAALAADADKPAVRPSPPKIRLSDEAGEEIAQQSSRDEPDSPDAETPKRSEKKPKESKKLRGDSTPDDPTPIVEPQQSVTNAREVPGEDSELADESSGSPPKFAAKSKSPANSDRKSTTPQRTPRPRTPSLDEPSPSSSSSSSASETATIQRPSASVRQSPRPRTPSYPATESTDLNSGSGGDDAAEAAEPKAEESVPTAMGGKANRGRRRPKRGGKTTAPPNAAAEPPVTPQPPPTPQLPSSPAAEPQAPSQPPARRSQPQKQSGRSRARRDNPEPAAEPPAAPTPIRAEGGGPRRRRGKNAKPAMID